MSVAMGVQRFRDERAPPMDPVAFHAVFGPYVDRVVAQLGFFHLRTPDGGGADVYARMQPDFDGMTITRFSAGQVLDLVVEFARAVDAVIMPVGCPTCVIDGAQIPHLPEPLRADTRLVTNGADVEAAIAER
jgi:hypothetical protein